jgi:hypothetical protein
LVLGRRVAVLIRRYLMAIVRRWMAHYGKRATKLTRMRRKGAQWHLVHGGGDEGSVRVAVDWAMIDTENPCLAIKEGVWTWIRGAFYDVLSKYYIGPVRN